MSPFLFCLINCLNDKKIPFSVLSLFVLAAAPVIPINDIKGTEGLGYSKGEKLLRCKLAACYRLVELNGWGHGIYNHITVSSLVTVCVNKPSTDPTCSSSLESLRDLQHVVRQSQK